MDFNLIQSQNCNRDKKVLVRVDYNVPMINGNIEDDTRIQKSLPTIRHLLSQGASIVLCSHIGRPGGVKMKNLSLYSVFECLKAFLPEEDVMFVNDCIGKKVKEKIDSLKPRQILLLENLRFYKEEEENDDSFSSHLAEGLDLFVQDAFGVVHRKHASSVGVTKYLSSFAGLLLQDELTALDMLLKKSSSLVVIVGGLKVSDKIGVVQNLIDISHKIIIGGAMSYTFLKGLGRNIGNSVCQEDQLPMVKNLLEKYSEKIILPLDHVMVKDVQDTESMQISQDQNISDGYMGVDIGQKSIQLFKEVIKTVDNVFWNGPMGIFEKNEYSQGTLNCARALGTATQRGAFTVVGGGDSVSAINRIRETETVSISHISTGGGSSLKFLEGRDLPGVGVLKVF